MNFITRFAPSPTGVLHTGSARTALFNWLFARHNKGKFLLRIEDTDQERSKEEHVNTILQNLKWLGLDWDGDVVYQLRNQMRHRFVAEELLKQGKAYLCFSSIAELENFRNDNRGKKFYSPWRNRSAEEAPTYVKPVIRLKANNVGSTFIHDEILGDITVSNEEIDDMVLLRADGTPTYMLAVVVDDHDMGITHVIRGDDHLTNAFRQKQIYEAMGWDMPKFAHIPLIHDKNGKKLSKREGALGIDAYEQEGYLPQAVVNHLMRLGWGYQDKEIISTEEAVEWFTLEGVGKSPAKFDKDKLNHINSYYIKSSSNEELMTKIIDRLPKGVSDQALRRIKAGMNSLKQRANTLIALTAMAEIYIDKRTEPDIKCKEIMEKGGTEILPELINLLKAQENWDMTNLQNICEKFAQSKNLKPSLIMQMLRATVLGTFNAPSIFEIIEILGKDDTLKRIGPLA
jgi:glutamyl-tRNA synthetase